MNVQTELYLGVWQPSGVLWRIKFLLINKQKTTELYLGVWQPSGVLWRIKFLLINRPKQKTYKCYNKAGTVYIFYNTVQSKLGSSRAMLASDVKMFDAGKTRMIGLPYGKKQ